MGVLNGGWCVDRCGGWVGGVARCVGPEEEVDMYVSLGMDVS